MISEKGEEFEFYNYIKPEGAVENWMNKFEDEMKKSLNKKIKEGIFYYPKIKKVKWLKETLGMVTLISKQIWWTWRVEDVFKKVKNGDKYAMKKEVEFLNEAVTHLIKMVRTNLELEEGGKKFRTKINTMIINDVHARDIVESFVRDSILNAKEFKWESQLRFYWINGMNDIKINQCSGEFKFGYEYQGLSGRLVKTPLTDKCIMTMTTALTFKLGGSPIGPAGTGKTETIKDLAKSFGRKHLLTNCGKNFDSFTMGNNFSGLCQTGFWGIFDEFNRIKPDVLSVVASQIKSIQLSLLQNKKTVKLLGKEINLITTLGYFITMNPDYIGRSPLPDNLKVLFRPVTMVKPNNLLICENVLMSEGFLESKSISKKMTVLYKLSFEQLSKKSHYDFGLRALKSVLMMAGNMKRTNENLSEEEVMMKALIDTNIPKLVEEDVDLFMGLIKDLFPNMELIKEKNNFIQNSIRNRMKEDNLVLIPKQIEKVVQLFDTMFTRHCVMLVGPTCSGKSTIINTLKNSMFDLKKLNVKTFPLNAKALEMAELYGEIHPQTREWADGVISHIFKKANIEEDVAKNNNILKWILFDGDVDSVWIENMNSVMDESKLLTLSNFDRIKLQDNCKLLFEVADLTHASMATITRCGMVFIDDTILELNAPFWKWAKKYPNVMEEEQTISQLLLELYQKYIPFILDFIFKKKKNSDDQIQLAIELTPLNMITQLCKLMDAMIEEHKDTTNSIAIESFFVFSLVWSFGGCLSEENRIKLDKLIKNSCSVKVPSGSLFDSYYDSREKQFMKWEEHDDIKNQKPEVSQNQMLILTSDTIRHSFILKKLMNQNYPVLFVGYPGTGKTITIESFLKKLHPEKNSILKMNFSSKTKSKEVQLSIESMTEKKRPKLYGPKGNKRLVIFIDEMHMPEKDFDTQQPIAFLRFLIDQKLMYERGGNLELRTFKNLSFVGSFLPPKGGHNKLNPRFLSLFNLIEVAFPSEKNIKKIYNTILLGHLKNYSNEVKEIGRNITDATVEIYQKICEKLPRTPIKFHYVFNLRDLSRVFQGLARSNKERFNKKENFVYLWSFEIERVFCDRLMTKEDINLFKGDIVKEVLSNNFEKEFIEKVANMKGKIIDFMLAEPIEDDYKDPKILEIVEKEILIKEKCEDMLEKFNEEYPNKKMDLVLFNDAVEHLNRILRIVSFQNGNGLMIGFGGSGKQSLIKLAAFIKKIDIFEISLKKNYKENHFRDDIRNLLLSLTQEKETIFFLNDSHIIKESFLEIINGLLNVGIVDSLFDEQEKTEIKNDLRERCKREKRGETSDEIWEFFRLVVQRNLHIILSMSPAGETLRRRCQEFPGIINCTTINWFFEWPHDALKGVSAHYLNEIDMNFKPELISYCVDVHQNVLKQSEIFEKKTQRKNFVTAKSYLDFINNFKILLSINKNKIFERIQGLERGLDKLEESSNNIESMKIIIAKDKKNVEKEKKEVEILLNDIAIKSKDVSEKKKIASEKQAQLEEENEMIRQNKEKSTEILDKKKPALEAALQKVAEIKKPEIDNIKKLNSPIDLIKNTVACLQILKVNSNADETQGWNGAKAMLSDIHLIKTLLEYSKNKSKISEVKKSQIEKIDEKLRMINNELKAKNKKMFEIYSACDKLLSWVYAIKLLYETNQIVKPLETKIKELTIEKEKKEKALKVTNENLKQLTEELEILNQKRVKKQEILQKLTYEVEMMESKLMIAERLITNLQSEKIRWSSDQSDLKFSLEFLEGECVLSAAFLSYYGPFEHDFRKTLFQEHKDILISSGVKIRNEFRVEDLLTSEVQVAEWNSQGLPADDLSVQNGILTLNSQRFPYCIDPQLQAVKWIKRKEGRDLKILIPSDSPEFSRTIEMSVKFGKILLIENVGEELDPMLDPILLKNFMKKNGKTVIMLGSEELEFNKNFKLFMTCKLGNPQLTPEIMGKTSVINYSVTFSGLREQLLNEVVGFEQEEKEKQRKELIMQMSENKKMIKEFEDKLLTSLANSDQNLIENEELVRTLEDTKLQAISIDKALKEAVIAREIIEQARLNYQDVARRGAILFFCMHKLSAISKMYEYSLESYLEVFKRALEEAESDNILNSRKNNIIEKLTHNVYDYVTLGLFEKHKLMFSFQMTLMIMEDLGNNEIKKYYNFFLRGNTELKEIDNSNKVDWLSPAQWKDLEKLSTLDEKFLVFKQSIISNSGSWKIWSDSHSPEYKSLPSSFIEKILEMKKNQIQKKETIQTEEKDNLNVNNLNVSKDSIKEISEQYSVLSERKSCVSLSKSMEHHIEEAEEAEEAISKYEVLMILKILRPDRVINGIKRFILDFFKPNEHFIQTATPNLQKVFSQSTSSSPIVFILSPGADPISEVEKLALENGFTGNKFKYLSLGQNMEKEAENAILESAERGNWIMLQNCDLLPEWLPNLESILENLDKPHVDFRLWLTTKPTDAFPIGIIQKATKIVTEPPDGLKQNIKALTSKLSDDLVNNCKHPCFKTLNYVIMFFHAVLLDRKKFGKIGFNITYDFNESDFKISFRLLSLYLNKSMQNNETDMPWDSLKYLIGDAMYGGRVTDEFDERVLKTYLEEYMGDFLFDKNNKFYFAMTDKFGYSVPEFNNMEHLNLINDKIPIFDHPTIFGLHENAEITYFNNAAKEIWKNLIKISSKSNGASSKQRDSTKIHNIAKDILEFIPSPFDINQMREDAPSTPSSTYIVLLQETERFNVLIEEMKKSLKNLFRGLSGEIAINSEIEVLIEELENGFLPSTWRKYCPKTNKSLASWIIHFKRRLSQYKEWIKEKKLNVIWLAGLQIPESYLTAIIQSCCRKKKWALDKVKLRTRITKFDSKTEIKKELQFGCYVQDMFLEGASWSKSQNCIVKQSPKELICHLPLMEIVPVERRKLKSKDTISIPVYVTQSRSSVGQPGLVFNASLSTKEHESHWILQGIAIVLNKD